MAEPVPQGLLPDPADNEPQPVGRFDWERLIRRYRLGFYEGKTRDPKRWIRHSTVQQIALIAATYADLDGTRIRPSVARVALVCEQPERTVRACLGHLQRLGLLTLVAAHRSPGRGGGPGRAAEYRMSAPENLPCRLAHLDPDEQKVVIPDRDDVYGEHKAKGQ